MGLLTVATKIHVAIVVCKFPQDMEEFTMSRVGNVCEAGCRAFLTCLPGTLYLPILLILRLLADSNFLLAANLHTNSSWHSCVCAVFIRKGNIIARTYNFDQKQWELFIE